MNLDTVHHLRGLLADSDWLSRTRAFATALRTAGHSPGGLLLVGTPDHEPWHFAAHLDDTARLTGQPQLAPTLVRHHVPVGAAPHLAVDLTRLHSAARGQTVLIVAPTTPTADLLNRVVDARRAGAIILTIDTNDHDLHTLAHDTLTVAEPELTSATTTMASVEIGFDTAQHLVTLATGEAIGAPRAKHRLDHLRRSLDKQRRR